MKKTLIFLASFFIAVILFGIILQRCDKPEVVTYTEYVYDTKIVKIPSSIPIPYFTHSFKGVNFDRFKLPPFIIFTDTVYLPTEIDTMAILAGYFAVVEYRDTIADESLKFYLNEQISQNRIIGRQTSYQWIKPTVVNTSNIYSTYLYAGLLFYQNLGTNTSSIGITLNYSSTKLTGMVGYDPINKGAFVGAGLKLFNW